MVFCCVFCLVLYVKVGKNLHSLYASSMAAQTGEQSPQLVFWTVLLAGFLRRLQSIVCFPDHAVHWMCRNPGWYWSSARSIATWVWNSSLPCRLSMAFWWLLGTWCWECYNMIYLEMVFSQHQPSYRHPDGQDLGTRASNSFNTAFKQHGRHRPSSEMLTLSSERPSVRLRSTSSAGNPPEKLGWS